MVAPRGTHSFSSAESRAAETATRFIVIDELKRRPDFGLAPSLSYADLLGRDARFAVSAEGHATMLEPDPGFLMYRNRVVAIPEVKYQENSQNAVERCFRWFAVAALPSVRMPLDRLLFAFYGPGFQADGRGRISGQTGGVVELCTHLPVRLLVNASPEEFQAELSALLDEIEANPGRTEDLIPNREQLSLFGP